MNNAHGIFYHVCSISPDRRIKDRWEIVVVSFISFPFYFFLAVLLAAYFLLPSKLKKYQWIVLLIGSYFFYLSANVLLVFFIAFSTCSAFFAARWMDRINEGYKEKAKGVEKAEKKELKKQADQRKKIILAVVLVLNFSILAFFKHFNTLADYANSLLSFLGIGMHISRHSFLLPLGISFYTFQSMGYLVDVYRGKISADRNLAKYALFVSFFPQLIQGPISRYDELAGQLYASRKFDYTKFVKGGQLILWGLLKKMVIADRISVISGTIFAAPQQYTGLYVLIGAIAAAVYVYTDFSGGVDVARGCAQLLGIHLPENFMRPFFANSLSDYWRRWHITLNEWWRDYLFYPMSLSKPMVRLGKWTRTHFGVGFGKILPVYICINIVRVINALWHGADPKYIVSGFYNGIVIVLGMAFTPLFTKAIEGLHIKTNTFSWRVFQILRTFFLVCISRIILSARDVGTAFSSIGSLFSNFNPWILFDGSLLELGLNAANITVLLISLGILMCVSIMQEQDMQIRERLYEQNIVFQWSITIACIMIIIIFGQYGIGYDAASFVYTQF